MTATAWRFSDGPRTIESSEVGRALPSPLPSRRDLGPTGRWRHHQGPREGRHRRPDQGRPRARRSSRNL